MSEEGEVEKVQGSEPGGSEAEKSVEETEDLEDRKLKDINEVKDQEVIESRLGDVKISKERFERENIDPEVWETVEENYPESMMIHKLHFSNIESFELMTEPIYPSVHIEMKEKEGKVFFKEESSAEEFFKQLRYRYRAFLECFS